MDEEVLQDRADRPVVRIGDTVRHLPHPWSPAVRELLAHLQSVGFDRAPRFLGLDDSGREVLSYLPGDSGGDGWSRIVGDAGLRNLAALLRDYHAAVAGFRPSSSLAAAPTPAPGADVLICHGDPGPWNVVWDGDRPVGLLDWEYAVLAPREHDIGYALDYAVPFRDDETTLGWHHFPELPDRPARVASFAQAYGLASTDGLVEMMLDAQRFTLARVRLLAATGARRQIEGLTQGWDVLDEQRLAWCEQNRPMVESR